ncbi:hypothetical protein BDY24DRAFT_395768 [Mrakia frigida]|uniref:zinc finger MYND domain-containing protein n=1 Tax=Mrakia frigida TaxID=29902 RepID=UPI003FCBFE70
MTSSYVAKFGDIIGLYRGLHGSLVGLPTATAAIEAWDLLMSVPSEQKAAFQDEVAAEYLPALLQRVMQLPIDFESPSNISRLYIVLGWLPLKSLPYRSRFARQHGEEAVAFYVALLGLIYKLPKDLGPFEDGTFPLRLLVRLIEVANLTWHDLVWNYPVPSIPVPQPSPTELQALHRVVEVVERQQVKLKLRPTDVKEIARFPRLVSILGISDLEVVRSDKELQILKPWVSCEWARVETKRGQEREVCCVRLPDGEEMRACSRCLTVRFCGEGHQKLHWKQHKKSCFTTSW